MISYAICFTYPRGYDKLHSKQYEERVERAGEYVIASSLCVSLSVRCTAVLGSDKYSLLNIIGR